MLTCVWTHYSKSYLSSFIYIYIYINMNKVLIFNMLMTDYYNYLTAALL